MTFHATFQDAQDNRHFAPIGNHCFCCNEPISGPTITYDGFPTGDGIYKSVHMHRDCAFSMANAIILDAWPNRRAEKDMQTVKRPSI